MTCAICGQGDHRFGTTDSERDYDAMACVNMLLAALDKANAELSQFYDATGESTLDGALRAIRDALAAEEKVDALLTAVWEMLDGADDLLVEVNPEWEHDRRCHREALDILHEAMEMLIPKGEP